MLRVKTRTDLLAQIILCIAQETAIYVTHTVLQTEILALPDSWITNTLSVKMRCPQKIVCAYFFG
jgi:hypothetical protein